MPYEESLLTLSYLACNVYELHNYKDGDISSVNIKALNDGLSHYEVIVGSIRNNTGSCAMAVWKHKDNGRKILAIKGTDPSRGSDVANDIAMVLGGTGSALAVQLALSDARALIKEYGVHMITGHSLGGYMAEIIATNDRIDGASFQGPGVNGPVVKLGGSAHPGFQNIQAEHDGIGNFNCAAYTHVQWSVYIKGAGHGIDYMWKYFNDHHDLTNVNVVSRSESWATGYYYPK